MADIRSAAVKVDKLRSFQDRVFAQDLTILESQRPKRMPLGPGIEVPQQADHLSAAYRRMLKELDMSHGVISWEFANSSARDENMGMHKHSV